MTARERLFVALDLPDALRARELVTTLSGAVGGFKIGLELFIAAGPALVRSVKELGVPVFLDLKLHDIPNTVAGAAASAARLGVDLLTVHALGGPEMIRRAVASVAEAAGSSGTKAPVVLAVTVLTSHDDRDLVQIGLAGPASEAVTRLATLARDAGAGGIVCSAEEVTQVRRAFAGGTLVVPGIRPAATAVRGDDQSRTATPAQAIARGADLLVVGRPITQADNPAAAAAALVRELEGEVGG